MTTWRGGGVLVRILTITIEKGVGSTILEVHLPRTAP